MMYITLCALGELVLSQAWPSCTLRLVRGARETRDVHFCTPLGTALRAVRVVQAPFRWPSWWGEAGGSRLSALQKTIK